MLRDGKGLIFFTFSLTALSRLNAKPFNVVVIYTKPPRFCASLGVLFFGAVKRLPALGHGLKATATAKPKATATTKDEHGLHGFHTDLHG